MREALCHAALYHDRNVNITWVHSEDLEKGIDEDLLRSAHGIIVPGGFGNRGIEGMMTSGLATPGRTISPTWACAWACR